MLEELKQDFKERFLNFETLKGMYLLPTGIVIICTAIFYINYIVHVTCVLFGIYFIVEGSRKILVNRIKQMISKNNLLLDRLDT